MALDVAEKQHHNKLLDGDSHCATFESWSLTTRPQRTRGIQKGNQPNTKYLTGTKRPDRLEPVPQTAECEGNTKGQRAVLWRCIQATDNGLVFWSFIMAKAIIQAITADDIDNLGMLIADISRLTSEADAIKTRLKKGGVDKYNGELYTATIVKQDRTSYDPRKVEKLLGDLVSQVEKVTNVTKVMVSARQV